MSQEWPLHQPSADEWDDFLQIEEPTTPVSNIPKTPPGAPRKALKPVVLKLDGLRFPTDLLYNPPSLEMGADNGGGSITSYPTYNPIYIPTLPAPTDTQLVETPPVGIVTEIQPDSVEGVEKDKGPSLTGKVLRELLREERERRQQMVWEEGDIRVRCLRRKRDNKEELMFNDRQSKRRYHEYHNDQMKVQRRRMLHIGNDSDSAIAL